MRGRRILLVLLALALALLAGAIVYIYMNGGLALRERAGSAGNGGDAETAVETELSPEPIELEILCAGDVMLHNPQLNGAARAGGVYDFSGYFPHVRPFVEAADLSIVNMEFTFGGPPYSGYPLFSAPDEMAAALKESGFDIAVTSNNHMLDTLQAGVVRTVQVAKASGLLVAGSVEKPEDKDWVVAEAKGVKIGLVAYTYETADASGGRYINGNPLSDETRALINSYSPYRLDEDMEAVRASIDGAKADGAELIICYFHWGEEYQQQPDDRQRRTAEIAVSMGADIIFASHPHVLQPFELLADPASGRQVPVFWAIGNFVSNQRVETLDSKNRYTEQGIMAKVGITLSGKGKKISAMHMGYIPTWVERWMGSSGTYNYSIIPLTEGYQSNPDVLAAGDVSGADEALSDITALLGPQEGPGFDTEAEEMAAKEAAAGTVRQAIEDLAA